MSVLVEALSLIIPRLVLDICYPGGAEAFMEKMCLPEIPARLVCADDDLVSVSFLTIEQAKGVQDELLEIGIVLVDEKQFVDMAFLDQRFGPTMPCEWLEWNSHPEGYTYCWKRGTNPDPMHAPEAWTPEQSRQLTREDIRDEPGRFMMLADEDGIETWLDLSTGQISQGFAQRNANPESATSNKPLSHMDFFTREKTEDEEKEPLHHPLRSAVRNMLDYHGYTYHQRDEHTIHLTIRSEQGLYNVIITMDEEWQFVRIVGTYGSAIPLKRRDAIAAAASRANVRLGFGNFELEFEKGQLRFRASVDVEGGILAEKMADTMLGCTVHSMDRFHQAFMYIAFSDREPGRAMDEVR